MKSNRKIENKKKKKRCHTIANQKKAGIPIVISERIDLQFKSQSITNARLFNLLRRYNHFKFVRAWRHLESKKTSN